MIENPHIWLFENLPLPHGVTVKAEASYYDEITTGIYAKRNMLLDFSKCSDQEFERIDFSNLPVESTTMKLLLQLFYFDVFEGVFGKLSSSRLGAGPEENVAIYYGAKFTCVMRVVAEGESSNFWFLDLAICCTLN